MVVVHYVNVGLFHVVSEGGPVLLKNDPSTTMKQIAVASQEHRVMPRTTGPSSTANSAGHPTVPAYLAAEALDDFALAYMDQFTIVTQMIA